MQGENNNGLGLQLDRTSFTAEAMGNSNAQGLKKFYRLNPRFGNSSS